MNRLKLVKGRIAKGIGDLIELAKHVGPAGGVPIDPDRSGEFVNAASDVENSQTTIVALRGKRAETLLERIHDAIRLVLRNHQGRRKTDRVRPAAEHQNAALETHGFDTIA